jgi:hypothetical protein
MSVIVVDSRNNSNTGLITAGSAIVGGGSGVSSDIIQNHG